MLPSPGRLVPGACCPGCKAGQLYYAVAGRHLYCRACVWQAHLLPAEAGAIAGALSGIDAIPAVIARIGQRVAVIDAPPDQAAFCDRGGKWHVVPRGPETPEDHLARLAEQADLNHVSVVPLNREHTEFRVTSQRRKPDGASYPPYRVRLSAWAATCDC